MSLVCSWCKGGGGGGGVRIATAAVAASARHRRCLVSPLESCHLTPATAGVVDGAIARDGEHRARREMWWLARWWRRGSCIGVFETVLVAKRRWVIGGV